MESPPLIYWHHPVAPPFPLQRDALHLWLIDLDQPEILRQAASRLSHDEQERAERIRSPQEQRRFILARSAMRSILAGYLDQPASEIPFRYGDKGKPAVALPGCQLEFNLSHAKAQALLAVTNGQPVGVDLEPLTARPGLRRIATRVFPANILDRLQPLVDEQYTDAFLKHWTALEARVKAGGEGVFSRSDKASDLIHRHFQPASGWIAAVAMAGGPPPPDRWSTYRFQFDYH